MVTSSDESDIGRLVRHVRSRIDLADAELGEEFFPAHLSVALIDAFFTPRLDYHKQVVPVVERYCERFKLHRIRSDRSRLPHVDEQETLTNLIDHYETLDPGGFQEEIVRYPYCSPGTRILKSENVRCAAMKMRKIGIEILQDAQSRPPGDIKRVLRPLSGIGPRTIHMFLMYVGNDEYVKGDVHVCRFVAEAVGKDESRIPAKEAERLVLRAARELEIAPRLLDYEIWKLGATPNKKSAPTP